MMQINVITIFPEMILSAFKEGVVARAKVKGVWELNVVNLRDYTTDVHQSVDDRPYGGGDGMVMMTEPIEKALLNLQDKGQLGHVVYLSPQGRLWKNSLAIEYSNRFSKGSLTFICGRYGGIDQRLINEYIDEELSIGDYVLSGGEFAAAVVIDSILRFVPGVLGNTDSPYKESFDNNLLEAPQFTRPSEFKGVKVPHVLMSGNHEKIEDWRRTMGLLVTASKRPDLLTESHIRALKESSNKIDEITDEELKSCGLSGMIIKKVTKLIKPR